jgi:hypothetical protein
MTLRLCTLPLAISLEREIDVLVYGFYGLTDKEIAIVKGN